jgi:hypothetical protein
LKWREVVIQHRLGTCQKDQVPDLHAALAGGSYRKSLQLSALEKEYSRWVRPLNAAEAHRLDRTEDARLPFWSPDGQFIAFLAENKLKRVPAGGGPPQTICDVPIASSLEQGGAWNQDGVIIFASTQHALMRVSAAIVMELVEGRSPDGPLPIDVRLRGWRRYWDG